VHSFKTTALAGAVLLALSGGIAQAQPRNENQALKETVQELSKQLKEIKERQGTGADSLDRARIDELTRQVNELRAQLQKRNTDAAEAKAASTSEAQEGESDEAVQARTPATKADVQGLRTDLENYKYDNARQLERNVPSVTRNTKIGGSIVLGYQTWNPGSANSTSNTTYAADTVGESRKNGFTPATVALNFTGTLYRDYGEGKNLTYRGAFTTSTNNATANSSSSSSSTLGNTYGSGTQFNVTDAYLRYSFQAQSGNAEDPLGTVTLGQQVVPFGLDAQALDPEVRAAINSASYVSGLGFSTRQVGVVLSGDYDPYVDFTNNYRAPLLGYAFGLFNGNGANKQDNNSVRDVSARLVYTLPVDYASWLRQLQIGASYYRGLPTINKSATGTLYQKSRYDRTGFDINWTHLPFSIAYEWAYGKQEVTPTAANLLINPDGQKRSVDQYINFGYTWGEQFLNSSKQQGKFDDWWPQSYQAFLRFDSWDPNRSYANPTSTSGKDHVYTTTVGLNVFFAETTSFKINYLHVRNQLGAGVVSTATNPQSTNGIQAQFSATF